MPTQKLTAEIITAAIEGFESQQRRIDDQIAELQAMLAGGSTQAVAAPEPAKRKRRNMSTAGRKAISAATKKRWAAFHAAQQASEQPTSKKAARKSAKKTARKKTAPKNAAVEKVVAKKTATKTGE